MNAPKGSRHVRRSAAALFSLLLPAGLVVATHASCGSNQVSGTWSGSTDAEGATSMATRLDLTETTDGVTGTVLTTFPGTSAFTEVDTLTGTRSGDAVHLVGATGITLDLTRSGTSMAGSLTFTISSSAGSPVVAKLSVTRS